MSVTGKDYGFQREGLWPVDQFMEHARCYTSKQHTMAVQNSIKNPAKTIHDEAHHGITETA